MHLSTLILVAIQILVNVEASPLAQKDASQGIEYVPRTLKQSKHLRPVLEKRGTAQFVEGQPDDGNGKGGPLIGMLPQKGMWLLMPDLN